LLGNDSITVVTDDESRDLRLAHQVRDYQGPFPPPEQGPQAVQKIVSITGLVRN
jgi:hypothetical protein